LSRNIKGKAAVFPAAPCCDKSHVSAPFNVEVSSFWHGWFIQLSI